MSGSARRTGIMLLVILLAAAAVLAEGSYGPREGSSGQYGPRQESSGQYGSGSYGGQAGSPGYGSGSYGGQAGSSGYGSGSAGSSGSYSGAGEYGGSEQYGRTETCFDNCKGGIFYRKTGFNRESRSCIFEQTPCEFGCNAEGTACAAFRLKPKNATDTAKPKNATGAKLVPAGEEKKAVAEDALPLKQGQLSCSPLPPEPVPEWLKANKTQGPAKKSAEKTKFGQMNDCAVIGVGKQKNSIKEATAEAEAYIQKIDELHKQMASDFAALKAGNAKAMALVDSCIKTEEGEAYELPVLSAFIAKPFGGCDFPSSPYSGSSALSGTLSALQYSLDAMYCELGEFETAKAGIKDELDYVNKICDAKSCLTASAKQKLKSTLADAIAKLEKTTYNEATLGKNAAFGYMDGFKKRVADLKKNPQSCSGAVGDNSIEGMGGSAMMPEDLEESDVRSPQNQTKPKTPVCNPLPGGPFSVKPKEIPQAQGHVFDGVKDCKVAEEGNESLQEALGQAEAYVSALEKVKTQMDADVQSLKEKSVKAKKMINTCIGTDENFIVGQIGGLMINPSEGICMWPPTLSIPDSGVDSQLDALHDALATAYCEFGYFEKKRVKLKNDTDYVEKICQAGSCMHPKSKTKLLSDIDKNLAILETRQKTVSNMLAAVLKHQAVLKARVALLTANPKQCALSTAEDDAAGLGMDIAYSEDDSSGGRGTVDIRKARLTAAKGARLSVEGEDLILNTAGNATLKLNRNSLAAATKANSKAIGKVEVAVEDKRPVYKVQRSEKVRLLGLFQVQLNTTEVVDVATAKQVRQEKPWWAFLVR